MWRFANFLIALMMLVVSFFSPETRWDLNFNIWHWSFYDDLFFRLFMCSMLLHIPLLISGALLAAADLIALLEKKKSRVGILIAITSSLATVAALYRLNNWVFTEIF